MRDILVTSALPYANGSIHIGHLVEYIQTDIWVRTHKLIGNNCYYVCADDAHGTPIMLKADELGISPLELIKQVAIEHQQDFADFDIEFDNYHSTHSPENQEISEDIYNLLFANGFIARKTISQAYDPEKNMFLPDRYIKGNCPKCGSEDQYGDSCESCGSTYSPTELINPKSMVSGATPITKESEHFFFELPKFTSMLENYLDAEHLQAEVSSKLKEWFAMGLKNWDITRDAPYFGFKIPNTEDKYFYVWLDAPIGYAASFKNLSKKTELDFDRFWHQDSETELVHFIGKDIIYFHALFWPAVLHGSGYRMPTKIYAHGFLTVDGKKMSKSRGTFIKARTYLNNLNPEALRYYFAAKLGDGIDDIDLNLEDFRLRVNSDLVGKVINIASRCAGFINKKHGGILAQQSAQSELYQSFIDQQEEITDLLLARKYNQAVRKIMHLADLANKYIDQNKPWLLAKDPDQEAKVHEVCSLGLNLFRVLMTYLSPIVPKMATQAAQFLNCDLTLQGIAKPLTNHKINRFKPLMQRIETSQIEKMITESKEDEAEKPASNLINIDEFAKMDMQVAEIIKAETVEGSDKLLKIQLDLGHKQVQVFSGIKDDYSTGDLIGKKVIALVNLAPRKMRFGVSEGMILAAEDNSGCFLLTVDQGASAGMKVC